jgi:DDE family transposase
MDALRHDPVMKMACERAPDAALGLASQPTLSRLENLAGWRMLARMGLRLIDLFCDSLRTVPGQITLDIDDTTDRTHGAQQLSLFNTPADGHCFQPIHIYEAATGKPVAFLLRPGRRPSGVEAARVLRHVIRRIRTNWPRVAITVRGDGHYGTPEVMDLLEQLDCSYILGLPGNARLKEIAHPWYEDAATRRALAGKPKVRRFFQTSYAARSWSRERRVIARVEATALGSDVRFVVTNLTGRSKHLYEKVYCRRGAMENLIKEHKLYTKSDRTSCHRWEANQFRLFLHTAAYWLLHTLRGAAPKRSRWRTATFETIRRIRRENRPLDAFLILLIPQDRRPRRAVEDPDQALSAVSLPERADDRAHARPNTRSKPMTGAAIAADEPPTPTPSAHQISASSKPGHAGRANAKTQNAFILMNNSG